MIYIDRVLTNISSHSGVVPTSSVVFCTNTQSSVPFPPGPPETLFCSPDNSVSHLMQCCPPATQRIRTQPVPIRTMPNRRSAHWSRRRWNANWLNTKRWPSISASSTGWASGTTSVRIDDWPQTMDWWSMWTMTTMRRRWKTDAMAKWRRRRRWRVCGRSLGCRWTRNCERRTLWWRKFVIRCRSSCRRRKSFRVCCF